MFTNALRAAALIAALVGIIPLHAQVPIADPQMRIWLNDAIPGIVDASGIMDTLNPGIATLDSVMFLGPDDQMDSLVDLDGMQYLTSLVSVTIFANAYVDVSLVCPEVPPSLRTFDCTILFGGAVHLPQLPDDMDRLWIGAGLSGSVDVDITGLPQTLDSFFLMGWGDLSWSGTGLVEHMILNLDQNQYEPITIPAVHVETLDVDGTMGYTASLDLSEVQANDLVMEGYAITGPILWPLQLHRLYVSASYLGAPLQDLPASLDSMSLSVSNLECLPWLPDSLEYLNVIPAVSCIANWPASLGSFQNGPFDVWDSLSAHYCSILNSACPGVGSGISGNMFIDLDQDGVRDAGEPPLTQATVTVQPSGNVAPCNAEGDWMVDVPPGTYTIAPSSTYPYIASYAPLQHSADLPVMGAIDSLNDFAVTLMPDIEDLQAFISAEPARPGFDDQLYLTCRNYGTVPMDAQLVLQFDADQTWAGSSITPDVLTGNTATWNFVAMAVGSTQNVTVVLNTPVGTPLGTAIDHALTVLPDLDDETAADNLAFWTDSVVGSYDPNDKLVSPAMMDPATVQQGTTRINYIIRFQNTGTASAERVVIADTLPAGLQPESVRLDGSSHPCTWYLSQGVLYFVFEGIQLPDSSADETASHGMVRFSILPETNLANGTTISNIGYIVFDFNEPIITPAAVFHVQQALTVDEQVIQTIRLYPNPVSDRLFVSLPEHSSLGYDYRVSDPLGRVVLAGRLNAVGTVDVGSLGVGVYTLEVGHGDTSMTLRFVKQ